MKLDTSDEQIFPREGKHSLIFQKMKKEFSRDLYQDDRDYDCSANSQC